MPEAAFEFELVKLLKLKDEICDHVGQNKLQKDKHTKIMTSFPKI